MIKLGDATWTYKNFHIFKSKLAYSIGINLEQMSGFGGCKSWYDIEDNLALFIHHEDNGFYSAQECANIYPRLLNIIENWQKELYGCKSDITQGYNLIYSMKYCAENDLDLWFE